MVERGGLKVRVERWGSRNRVREEDGRERIKRLQEEERWEEKRGGGVRMGKGVRDRVGQKEKKESGEM